MTEGSEFRAHRLPPYPLGELTGKVVTSRLSGIDVIDFSQMNPDLGAPQAAVDSTIQSLLLPHHHRYATSQGMSRLREEFCRFYASRFGVHLDPETECVVTMGIKEGLGHALLALCQNGDQVGLLTPSYPVHSAAALLAGASVLPLPLFASWEEAESLTYSLSGDSEAFFERLVTVFEHTWPKPKALLLSFPHNPTGTTVKRSFFDRLNSVVRAYGTYLLHDFAHAESFFEEGCAPSLLNSTKEGALEFYSFSKSFQMPGWRIGFAVGDQKLISALKRVKSYLDFGIFQPLQIGALGVLKRSTASLGEYREVYRGRRDVLLEGLSELGWKVSEHRAGSFVWCRVPSLNGAELSSMLIEKAGVAVSPGTGFDPSANEFIRFALGESEVRTREGLRRIRTFLEEYSGAKK